MGKGSGSVTAFSRADGFVTIPGSRRYLEAGDAGRGAAARAADASRPTSSSSAATASGSTAARALLRERGIAASRSTSAAWAGSRRRSAASATSPAIHLIDPATGTYNRPFLTPALDARARLRPDAGHRLPAGRPALRGQDGRRTRSPRRSPIRTCVMVNRNRGQRHAHPDRPAARRRAARRATARSPSRTTRSPPRSRRGGPTGAWRSSTVARPYGLGFLPLQEEHYDFVVPAARLERRRCGRSARSWRRRDADALVGLGFRL